MKIVHGHGILDILINSTDPVTRDSLQNKVAEKFGTDIYFTNCTGMKYTYDEILSFFLSRGKIVATPEGFSVVKEQICQD